MLGEWHDVEWELGQGTVELPRFTTEELARARRAARPGGWSPAATSTQLIEGPGDKALGRILQRARVDVDEAGTRAAATTAVTMRTVSMPMNPFHLDLRPALHLGHRARADGHPAVRRDTW